MKTKRWELKQIVTSLSLMTSMTSQKTSFQKSVRYVQQFASGKQENGVC